MHRMSALDRQVLHALPLAVYAVDVEGRVIGTNRGRGARDDLAAAFVADGAEVGSPIRDAISDPVARQQLDLAFEQVRSGRAPLVTWETPAGSDERVALVQLGPLHDGRKFTGFVLTALDITPIHRSRAMLLESAGAMACTDSTERVLQELAHQLRRTLGAERVAVGLAATGGDVRLAYATGMDDTGDSLARRLADGWREAMTTGMPAERERDGLSELSVPLHSGAGTSGAITVVREADAARDRHGWSRALEVLASQAAAALERIGLVRRAVRQRRVEAIGEVAAGVAHELRNPLFGISSAAQLLRYRSREDPVIEKNVGRILREAERLNRMATALLELGRPQPARLATGDPETLWDTVLISERGRLESHGLSVSRERAATPARCAFDPELLSQAFINLLANAADAAPEGSRIAIESTTLPGGAWRTRIHNCGARLAPDTIARAFDIFFSTRAGGAGLGLTLCERIIQSHDGTIALEGGPGGGATVTVVLPGAGDAARAAAR